MRPRSVSSSFSPMFWELSPDTMLGDSLGLDSQLAPTYNAATNSPPMHAVSFQPNTAAALIFDDLPLSPAPSDQASSSTAPSSPGHKLPTASAKELHAFLLGALGDDATACGVFAALVKEEVSLDILPCLSPADFAGLGIKLGAQIKLRRALEQRQRAN
jgi:hypothetical protein